MTLRAIVVGSGWARHAARALASDPRAELVAVVGRGSERTRALAASLGVPAAGSLEQAIADARPDVAAVAVHERENAEIVRRLLDAGAHVLVSHPVAPDVSAVQGLRSHAEARGLLVGTDYTMRLQPAFAAARVALRRSGALLRCAVQSPGRALVVGLDLAIGFAGPVERVLASRRYPPAVAARAERARSTFAPSVLLEHESGALTALVPVPHAAPARAQRVTLSAERARLDLELPDGGLVELRMRGAGRVETRVLVPPEPERSADAMYGSAMERCVSRFLDAVTGGAPLFAPLDEEARLRAVVHAIREATAREAPVDVGEVRPVTSDSD